MFHRHCGKDDPKKLSYLVLTCNHLNELLKFITLRGAPCFSQE